MKPWNHAPVAAPDDTDPMTVWPAPNRFLRSAIVSISLGCIAFLLMVLWYVPQQHARMVGPGFLLVLCAVAWALQAHGRVRAGVFLLVTGSWVLVTGICVFNGGVRTPAMTAFAPLIIMAGWLMGVRTVGTLAVLALAASLGFVVAEGPERCRRSRQPRR